MLSQEELQRYDRQIIMQDFGTAGQEKLKKTRILVAGAGGLASVILFYLAAAGIGNIRIIDHDVVEPSNLNRQVLHWQADIGKAKAKSAAAKLRRFNPHIDIEGLKESITEDNASRMAADVDLIVDALDNLPTRLLLNETAVTQNIPFFHGAVRGFEGRVMTIIPGKTACLACIYRGALPPEKFPVIGVTPAVIGSIQAAEVIKYVVGIGELLTNRLLVYDGLNMRFTELKVARNPSCPVCGNN